MRPRRLAPRILAAIGLGMATTIAIAWLGAAFEKAYHAPAVQEVLLFDGFTSRTYMQRGWTITRVSINWDLDANLARVNPSWIDARTHADLSQTPRWSQAWLPHKPARPAGTWGSWTHSSTLDELAAGWPFRALWCECDEPVQDPVSKDAVYSHRGGFTLPTHVIKDGARIFLPRALPYRPMWSGLAIDTALFGAAWALLFLAAPALRAWRRRKGRCGACGYDLRGLATSTPCPECGASPQLVIRIAPAA